jgi:protein O-mannosyl-transferase
MTVLVSADNGSVIDYSRLTPSMSDGAAVADAPARGTAARTLVACCAAAAVAGVVYLNALHNPFVYDDYHTVVANSSIQPPTSLRALVLHDVTRPIVNVSYALDRALWGPRPFGFHLTNVLLHMLNVVLLFLFARRLEQDREPRSGPGAGAEQTLPDTVAFAAAILFAVHPMMTEAVGYISGRSEVLCATFFLLAMLCGGRWLRGGGWKWGTATVGLWVAAIATKEPAAMFPLMLLVYDWLVVDGTAVARRRRFRTIHLPLVATALVAGLIRLAVLVRVEYPGKAAIHWSYILVELDVMRRYVGMLAYPVGQAIFHEVAAIRSGFEPRALLAIGVVGVLMTVAWRLRRAGPAASLGIVWFVVLLVPASMLILFDQGEPMTEHRMYLASCGAFLAAGNGIGWIQAAVGRSGRARAVVPVLVALVVLSLGLETWLRNIVWASPIALWQESVDLAPGHFRPRLLLGEALEDQGRRKEAIEEYKTAIRLRPIEPSSYVMLGRSLAEMGQFDEARKELARAIDIDPASVSARRSLAVLDSLRAQMRQP